MNMKSINELAWNVDEDTYRADPAISYSTLSRFEREGWRKIGSLFDKIDTPSLLFGSAVDCLLTDGEDDFNNRFIVCQFPQISDTLISITKDLHQCYYEIYDSLDQIPDEYISATALSWGYYKGASYNNYRVKQVKENCEEYYNLLTLAQNKTVLSQSDYDDVIRCVDELRINSATSHFFSESFDDNIEKVFQLKFKAEYEGIPVRCMFDELIVDHTNKVIYPIDLKTTGHPEEEFECSFAQWRYDIQAKLYSYILQECIKNDSYFKDFKIQYYQFVVINRRTVAPIVWKFEGNFGMVDLTDDKGNIFRDWRRILIDLKYYLDNPETKYSKEVLENNCEMKISNLKPI